MKIVIYHDKSEIKFSEALINIFNKTKKYKNV